MAKVTYDTSRSEAFVYDTWGKVLRVTATDGTTERVAEMKYDYFDRLIERTDRVAGEVTSVTAYAYDNFGRRTLRSAKVGNSVLEEKRSYDVFGRLEKIASGSDEVRYEYNDRNQLVKRTANNLPVYYTYTAQGQLATKSLGGEFDQGAIATLAYSYAANGQITGRTVNGAKADYSYDAKGQLLAVTAADGKVLEQYAYDPAGNILTKTIDGVKTTFTYDAANQLVSSETAGVVKNFAYDAAGRLVKAGDTDYSYGWLDKVLAIRNNGELAKTMSYHVGGQIAQVDDVAAGKSETFQWDGLALIQRNEVNYVNEPAITGGNPIVADGKALFDDMLGSTLGVVKSSGFEAIDRTAFGETKSNSDFNFFTGKPEIEGIGYNFLLRNYQASNGKWQTQDPMGYPDGWNNLAYVNNGVTTRQDPLGLSWVDDIITSAIINFANEWILERAEEAKNKVTDSDDSGIIVDGVDLSLITITYYYEDAWTLFFVPIGSGSGTIPITDLNIQPGEYTYENDWLRLLPNEYTHFADKDETHTDINNQITQVIEINQRFGEWYDFSALTITRVVITGNMAANSLSYVSHWVKE